MKIFVDIDETICNSNPSFYENAIPILDNIKKINKLYEQKHTIIYWTARGILDKKDYFKLTKDQLDSWGCLYHEVRFGKPYFDLMIDDKAKRIEEL